MVLQEPPGQWSALRGGKQLLAPGRVLPVPGLTPCLEALGLVLATFSRRLPSWASRTRLLLSETAGRGHRQAEEWKTSLPRYTQPSGGDSAGTWADALEAQPGNGGSNGSY